MSNHLHLHHTNEKLIPSRRSRFGCVVRLMALFAVFGALSVFAFAQTTDLTTLSRIEEKTDWNTCGACGNTGATGAIATYSMTRGITNPTIDGSSTKFSIGGSYPYKNAYWYIKHSNPPTTPVKYLKYEFDLFIPLAYANAPQAIEFEVQQKVGGRVYNFAWQAEYPQHRWRVFNFSTVRWEATTLSFDGFTPNKWHHIIAEFHVENGYAVHDALTIDGTRRAVSIRHLGKATTTGRYLSTGFQLDLNGKATDYKVYVDRMKISYK